LHPRDAEKKGPVAEVAYKIGIIRVSVLVAEFDMM